MYRSIKVVLKEENDISIISEARTKEITTYFSTTDFLKIQKRSHPKKKKD